MPEPEPEVELEHEPPPPPPPPQWAPHDSSESGSSVFSRRVTSESESDWSSDAAAAHEPHGYACMTAGDLARARIRPTSLSASQRSSPSRACPGRKTTVEASKSGRARNSPGVPPPVPGPPLAPFLCSLLLWFLSCSGGGRRRQVGRDGRQARGGGCHLKRRQQNCRNRNIATGAQKHEPAGWQAGECTRPVANPHSPTTAGELQRRGVSLPKYTSKHSWSESELRDTSEARQRNGGAGGRATRDSDAGGSVGGQSRRASAWVAAAGPTTEPACGGSSSEAQGEPSTDEDCLDMDSESRLVFPRGAASRARRECTQPTKRQRQLKRLRRRKRELEALVRHGNAEEAAVAEKELVVVLTELGKCALCDKF